MDCKLNDLCTLQIQVEYMNSSARLQKLSNGSECSLSMGRTVRNGIISADSKCNIEDCTDLSRLWREDPGLFESIPCAKPSLTLLGRRTWSLLTLMSGDKLTF
jgi:hypothetical protein